MKTTLRGTQGTQGPDEFEHRCPGRVNGEACQWAYYVSRVQPDIKGHAEQRHIDADKAFAAHVAEYHPHALPESHGVPT